MDLSTSLTTATTTPRSTHFKDPQQPTTTNNQTNIVIPCPVLYAEETLPNFSCRPQATTTTTTTTTNSINSTPFEALPDIDMDLEISSGDCARLLNFNNELSLPFTILPSDAHFLTPVTQQQTTKSQIKRSLSPFSCFSPSSPSTFRKPIIPKKLALFKPPPLGRQASSEALSPFSGSNSANPGKNFLSQSATEETFQSNSEIIPPVSSFPLPNITSPNDVVYTSIFFTLAQKMGWITSLEVNELSCDCQSVMSSPDWEFVQQLQEIYPESQPALDETIHAYHVQAYQIEEYKMAFKDQIFSALQRQSLIRPMFQDEISFILKVVDLKFDSLLSLHVSSFMSHVRLLHQHFSFGPITDMGTPPNEFQRKKMSQSASNALKKWFDEHTDHPYPSKQCKEQLAQENGISFHQVENWFGLRRKRTNITRGKRLT